MKTNGKVIAVPPGKTIREQLEERKMSVTDFARRMYISDEEAEGLLTGETPISAEMARRLETVLGVSAAFWNRLEILFREKLRLMEKEKAHRSK